MENCNNAEVFLAADTISVQHSPLGSFISYCLRLNWAEIFKKQHIKKSWNDRKSIQLCKKRRNQVYACLLCDTLTKSIGVPVLFVSTRRRGNTVGSIFLWTSFQTFGQPICSNVTKFFFPRLKPRTSNLRMCELFYDSLPEKQTLLSDCLTKVQNLKNLGLSLMSLVSHKKSCLVCVEFLNIK